MLATDAQGFPGEKLEDVPGAHHFRRGFDQGLAFFPGQQVAQFISACEQFAADEIQGIGPGLRAFAGPDRLCVARRQDRLVRVVGAGLGVQPDQVMNVRRAEVLPDAAAFDPLSRYQILVHGMTLRACVGDRPDAGRRQGAYQRTRCWAMRSLIDCIHSSRVWKPGRRLHMARVWARICSALCSRSRGSRHGWLV